MHPVYFPALDGEPACATMVIVSHAFHEPAIYSNVSHPLHGVVTQCGHIGVDVFFSLSGFLITYLLLSERRSYGHVDLRAFYIRRTLRIWPNYYVAVLAGFGIAALVGEKLGRASVESFLAHLAFLANWSDYPSPLPLGPLWSVCVEEQFYLVFPLVLVLSRGRHPSSPRPWSAWRSRRASARVLRGGRPRADLPQDVRPRGQPAPAAARARTGGAFRTVARRLALPPGRGFGSSAVVLLTLFMTYLDRIEYTPAGRMSPYLHPLGDPDELRRGAARVRGWAAGHGPLAAAGPAPRPVDLRDVLLSFLRAFARLDGRRRGWAWGRGSRVARGPRWGSSWRSRSGTSAGSLMS